MAVLPQGRLWTSTPYIGWDYSRVFYAGEQRLYITWHDVENPYGGVTLIDTSGSDIQVLDSTTWMDNWADLAAFYNNTGGLVISALNYNFDGSSPTWVITNDGSTISVSEIEIPGSVTPADYGTRWGPWKYSDVVSMSPDGSELVCGDTPVVDGTRVGRAWGVSTATGQVNWSSEYSLPALSSYYGPCVGSTSAGALLACYGEYSGGKHLVLVDAGGVSDQIAFASSLSTWKYTDRSNWMETGSSISYVLWDDFSGANLIRAAKVTGSTLSWATDEITIPIPEWVDQYPFASYPIWDTAKGAVDGQISIFPLVAEGGEYPVIWVDPITGEHASGSGLIPTAGNYTAVLPTSRSNTILVSRTETLYEIDLHFDKWGSVEPPVTIAYHPIRMSSRNDGQGTFEKHPRINTTGWQQWSSNQSQRITQWGKGSYQ